ncbi:MAG: AMP-binding protein [Candidatus Scalindua sp.]|nr:AMP-binding protein [Candidatus Scalindua sp.]
MSQIRKKWLETVLKYKFNHDKPGSPTIWSPDLEKISRERIKEIQSEKLSVAFDYLYEESQYYQEKFKQAKLKPQDIQSVEDLHKVPVTTKQEWLVNQTDNPPWGNFSPLSHKRWTTDGWMMFTTSGTTTVLPRVFRHTQHDLKMWAWLGARALWAMGVRPGDVVINCADYGPAVAFWCLHYAMSLVGCPVIPCGGMNVQRRAFFINTYKPTVLLCTPSYALYLGRTMHDLEYPTENSSIRIIITAGEPGPGIPSTKNRIEGLWGAKLHDDFGCTEVAMTPLGYTCEDEVNSVENPVNVHLMEDAYIPEVLNPDTLEPVREGERGILVVSNLFSEAQPILRYMMGDWTSITREPCACGRTHARALGGLHGRPDDMIKIQGLAFFPSTIEDSVRKDPELGDEFRVELSKVGDMDRVKIIVEPKSAIPKSSYIDPREKIQEKLKGLLGVDVQVELVPYGTLPRTQFKSKRVFDMREQCY